MVTKGNGYLISHSLSHNKSIDIDSKLHLLFVLLLLFIFIILSHVISAVIKQKMDKSKDSKSLTNAELEYRIKTNKNSNPKMLLEDINELSKRSEIKEQEYKQAKQENKKTQSKITIMTFIIMILTIIILGFTVAQFFKTHNHKQPMEKSIKP